MDDRTVHGWAADGTEIVRYDRAGKWYLEPKPSELRPRRQVTVNEAARAAAQGKAVFGRMGASVFDRLVRKFASEQES